MEGLRKFIGNVSSDARSASSSLSESFNEVAERGVGLAAALPPSSDQSRILVNRPARQFVSLLTCSKLCAFFFVAGVVVGYTLKRRVSRWASRLLKRLRDD